MPPGVPAPAHAMHPWVHGRLHPHTAKRADRRRPHRRQGQAPQAHSAGADEAAEAEHHVEKAARTEEPAARATPRGQALLQACHRVLRSLQPCANSVRDSCMLTLSLRQAPSSAS